MRIHLALATLTLTLAACDGGGSDTSGDNTDTPEAGICVSGDEWTWGNEESPLMNPGEACIACHDRENEGPMYLAAGTVYTAYDEPNDCNGPSGIEVELTDANGDVHTANTNGAGNFFWTSNAGIAFPVTARVLDGGVEVAAMAAEITDGDCNTCHSASGSGGAPGRIAINP